MNSLFGLALSGAIVAIMTLQFTPKVMELDLQRIDNGSAVQFERFTEAAQLYLEANAASLVAATASGPVSRTPAQLTSAAALDARFVDLNTFNQQHALLIRQNGANRLEALAVTYGGDAMPMLESIRLAQHAGPKAGVVRADTPTLVIGAAGAWSVPVSDFAAIPAALQPSAGRLAALISHDASADAAPYLYRFPQDDPSLNTLYATTQLDGAADIVNGDGTGGLIRRLSIEDPMVSITKPTCDTGAPAIFVTPVQASDNGSGYPIIGVQAWADTLNATTWRTRLQIFREDPAAPGSEIAVDVNPGYGRLQVVTRCQ